MYRVIFIDTELGQHSIIKFRIIALFNSKELFENAQEGNFQKSLFQEIWILYKFIFLRINFQV